MAVRPILLDFEYNLFNFFDERSEDEPRLLGRAKRQADYSARYPGMLHRVLALLLDSIQSPCRLALCKIMRSLLRSPT